MTPESLNQLISHVISCVRPNYYQAPVVSNVQDTRTETVVTNNISTIKASPNQEDGDVGSEEEKEEWTILSSDQSDENDSVASEGESFSSLSSGLYDE
ncbi:hypothetical protein IFR05_014818 [Cadophora sp. M221]|nr:hypothetical protein IFR05_014818 [Cadophora sp. M221]